MQASSSGTRTTAPIEHWAGHSSREGERRTGGEGPISHLKRDFGWNRTRLVTIQCARAGGTASLAATRCKIATLAA